MRASHDGLRVAVAMRTTNAWQPIMRRWPGAFALAECAAAVATMQHCFEQVSARIEHERASSCLELRGALAATANSIARQRLAVASLGNSEERLGAGQIAPARNALAVAALWGADLEAVARLRTCF